MKLKNLKDYFLNSNSDGNNKYAILKLKGNGESFIEDIKRTEIADAIDEISMRDYLGNVTKSDALLLRILLDMGGVHPRDVWKEPEDEE